MLIRKVKYYPLRKKFLKLLILPIPNNKILKGGNKMQDKVIKCKDCGTEFTFSVAEQEFYAQKGFQNDPVRCKECRIAKKARNNQ